jgi:hypothetical protein
MNTGNEDGNNADGEKYGHNMGNEVLIDAAAMTDDDPERRRGAVASSTEKEK